jgi:hypothetical protein
MSAVPAAPPPALAAVQIAELSRQRNAAVLASQQSGAVQAGSAESGAGPRSETVVFNPLTPEEVMSLPDLRWRVQGVLPDSGLAVLYGPSGCGKSFIVLDMLAAISRGVPWFGWRTEPCECLYFCLESTAGLKERMRAWEKYHGINLPQNLRSILQPLDINDRSHLDAFIAVAPKQGIIVVDTVSRATPGRNENDPKDMSVLIKSCDEIKQKTGCIVLLVSHTGKDQSKGLRGHSSQFAALDTCLEVCIKGCKRFIKVEKCKEADAGAQVNFNLKQVWLRMDDNAESVTSCVVETVEDDARHKDESRLSPSLQYTLDSLQTAIKQSNTDSVHVEQWRPIFYAGHTADKQDSKQKAFTRARTELVNLGKISVQDDFYKLASPTDTDKSRTCPDMSGGT